jgi:hypothetical protein
LVSHSKEKERLRVFKNTMLKTFGPRNGEMQKVTEVNNEKLCNLNFSSSSIKVHELKRG